MGERRGRATGAKAKRTCVVDATGDSVAKATKAIQQAIDNCAKSGGGIVTFKPGNYVSGALFLKSNVHLRVDTGVTLTGSQDDADYPSLWTRVAGVEMKWPAALINVNEQRNVKISGGGTIDGNGKKWWDKYWALRREYEPRGLRWASDYDAERVRLMVIWKSSDVTIENPSLKRSGFWTVQVVYSDHVTVDRIKITDNSGPSTDGVDIDSSSYVLVQNCDIDNNDDDICLKAGRDYDGLRVNRPTEYVVIRDNVTRRGIGWCAFDYNTHANFCSGDRVCYHGVSDIFRIPKPAAGLYKSQCDPKEEIVLEPAFDWARGDRNESFNVAMICSNCEHLKIYIGERLVADVDPDKENFGNLAHPPFVANIRSALGRGWGDLKIEGYIGGKVVITKMMSGKGVDHQLLVEPDDRELIGDGIDATRVVLKVTDEFGAVRPFANAAISLSLQGPAEIIGENPFALFGGVGAVWIKTKNSAGMVRLTATHATLGSKTVEFLCHKKAQSL